MTDPRPHTRRALLTTGGLSLALLAMGRAGLALAQDDASPAADSHGDAARQLIRERRDDFTHIWRATSPATHLGDGYTLTVANTLATGQELIVVTTIMDHRAHFNAPVIVEEIALAAGESLDLSASNDYGVANHFHSTVLANTGLATDLELVVVVEDTAGTETARFTQGAFMVLSVEELRATAEASARERRERRRRRRERRDYDPGTSPATPVPDPSA